MAGMRALGRVTNVLVNPLAGTVSAAGGTLVASFKECSGIEVIAYCGTASGGTLTVTAGTSAAAAVNGETYTTGNGFGQPSVYYTQNVGVLTTSRAGTVGWTKQTATWTTNTLPVGGSGTVSVVDFLCSEMADTYDYIAFTGSAGMSLTAVQYDLTVQRTPANLLSQGT